MTSSHLLLLLALLYLELWCACAHAWCCRRCWWCTCAFVFQIFGSVIYSSWVPRLLYRFSLRLKINDTSHIFAFVCQFCCYCCCFVPFVHSSDPSVKLAVRTVRRSVRPPCLSIQPSISTVWLAGRSLSSETCAFIVLVLYTYTYRSTTDDVGWGCWYFIVIVAFDVILYIFIL